MFIGSIAVKRTKHDGNAEDKWVRVGKLWWKEEREMGGVLLAGFKAGNFVGKIFPTLEGKIVPPFLAGDLLAQTGQYESKTGLKKEYQWVGYITTEQNHTEETVYWGELEVMPLCLVSDRSGVFLSIFGEYHAGKKAAEPAAAPNSGIESSDHAEADGATEEVSV